MRWIVRIVLTLVAVAVVAFGLLLLLPADRIARIATDKFETATGRAMTAGGAGTEARRETTPARKNGTKSEAIALLRT